MPDKLVGNNGFEGDCLDELLSEDRKIELILTHKKNRKKAQALDVWKHERR